jgi:hypothetical protein
MSLTTQSLSVPEVEAMRWAMGSPLIFKGSVSTSDLKESTSVRPEKGRWSSTSQRAQERFEA